MVIRLYLSPWYLVCTKEIVISEGMGSPKMSFVFRCKNRTDQYGPANHLRSNCAAYGRRWIFGVFRLYLSKWYRVCTKEILISEGSYGYGVRKNVICISVQKPYRPEKACKTPRFELRRIGPSLDFWGISVVPIAMVPCLH